MLASRILHLPLRRSSRAFSALPDLRPAPVHLGRWYEEYKELFSPPVCNKLMHKNQLMVMFVGGPNTRTDFHLDHGSEFFYQIRGNMELPIIEQGKRKHVKIKEGEVFCLPSRIPHSPQRPEKDALGLVVERKRYEDSEVDGLRWYKDFEQADEVLYQRYFYCDDLGRDLVPVVKEYLASEENKTRERRPDSVQEEDSFVQDVVTKVPDPFNLQDWLTSHKAELDSGAALNLFEGHPDREFKVQVIGGESEQSRMSTGDESVVNRFQYETFFHQLRGDMKLEVDGKTEPVIIPEDGCFVVGAGVRYKAIRPAGSLGLVVENDPKGNKQ